MHSEQLHFWVSKEMLKQIDVAARANFQSRSSFVRESIAHRLNSQSLVSHKQQEDQLQKIIDESARRAAQDFAV